MVYYMFWFRFESFHFLFCCWGLWFPAFFHNLKKSSNLWWVLKLMWKKSLKTTTWKKCIFFKHFLSSKIDFLSCLTRTVLIFFVWVINKNFWSQVLLSLIFFYILYRITMHYTLLLSEREGWTGYTSSLSTFSIFTQNKPLSI